MSRTSTHSQVELPLYSNLQAHFVLYCGPLTIPKPPWQMGFCMWIVLPGGMRRNPKGRNFGAKSIGHATSRGTANELKCIVDKKVIRIGQLWLTMVIVMLVWHPLSIF